MQAEQSNEQDCWLHFKEANFQHSISRVTYLPTLCSSIPIRQRDQIFFFQMENIIILQTEIDNRSISSGHEL